MDKISKALKNLSKKERKVVAVVVKRIKANNLAGFDVKKLKGYDNIFRVRKGSIRIIYKIAGNNISLLTIERRSDNTYHF